jgi:hypothetical protein
MLTHWRSALGRAIVSLSTAMYRPMATAGSSARRRLPGFMLLGLRITEDAGLAILSALPLADGR